MINTEKASLNKKIDILDLGMQAYKDSWSLQKELLDRRSNNEINDTLIFVEHESVYTLGKNADENHILQNHPDDVQTFHIERGGDVTYHGPGQLVGYPIIDLRDYKKSISWYMRSLEDVIIQTLREFSIISNRKEGMTGVWVDDEKICAMGVRLSRWVTMHGFALNLAPKMEYYDSMIPCGIQEYGITSMSDILCKDISMHEVIESLSTNFIKIFNIEEI